MAQDNTRPGHYGWFRITFARLRARITSARENEIGCEGCGFWLGARGWVVEGWGGGGCWRGESWFGVSGWSGEGGCKGFLIGKGKGKEKGKGWLAFDFL